MLLYLVIDDQELTQGFVLYQVATGDKDMSLKSAAKCIVEVTPSGRKPAQSMHFNSLW